MSRPSSANPVLPQDGRVRLTSEPVCRDVAAARAPPWPRVIGRPAVERDAVHFANTEEGQ
jgi:hypothetical protein